MRDFYHNPHDYDEFKPYRWERPERPQTYRDDPPTPPRPEPLQWRESLPITPDPIDTSIKVDLPYAGPETRHLGAGVYVPRPVETVRNLFTTDTFPKAIGSLIDLLQPPDLVSGTLNRLGLSEKGSFFTEEQHGFGKFVAGLTTETPRLFGHMLAMSPFDKADFPTYQQLGDLTEKYSPYSIKHNQWVGTRNIARAIQSEPGEAALEALLTGTGIGAAATIGRQTARLTRATARAIDPLSELPRHLDEVNVFTSERSLVRQLDEATYRLEVQGNRQWNIRDLSTFGRIDRQYGMGTAIDTGELVTAAHVIIGHPGRGFNPQRIIARGHTGQAIELPTLTGISTPGDIALLDLPPLPNTRPLSLPRDRDFNTVTGLGNQDIRLTEPTESAIRYGDQHSFEGTSGMGTIVQRGKLGDIYLGELHGKGLFGRTDILAQHRATPTPIAELDTPALRQQLATEGHHFQVARQLAQLQRMLPLQLHSGREQQLPLFDFDPDLDSRIRNLLDRADENPNIFWRFENPLEPTADFSQDYVQTERYPETGELLPDSFIVKGEGPFTSFESDTGPAYVARRGLYGIPHSEFLSELLPSQTHRIFEELETPLRFEEGRSLNLYFGVRTPYQQGLAPSEDVFLPLGNLESFATNIPHGTQYGIDASKGQFIDITGVDLDPISQKISELPILIDRQKIWDDYLKDPTGKTAERLRLEELVNPQLNLHSGRFTSNIKDWFANIFKRKELPLITIPDPVSATPTETPTPIEVKPQYKTIQDVLDSGTEATDTFFRVQPKGASVVGHRPVDAAWTVKIGEAPSRAWLEKARRTATEEELAELPFKSKEDYIEQLPPDARVEKGIQGSWKDTEDFVTRGGLYAGRHPKTALGYLREAGKGKTVGGDELVIFRGEELPGATSQADPYHRDHEAIVKPSQVLYRIPLHELSSRDISNPFMDSHPKYIFDFNVPAAPYSIDPTLPLHLHSGTEAPPFIDIPTDPFQLPRRLASHHTSHYNYHEIRDTGAILSGKQAGETIGMYDIDKYAGDDEYIFLGKYISKGQYTGSDYGDFGFIFPAETLINKYHAQASDVDLVQHYEMLEQNLLSEWAAEGRFPKDIKQHNLVMEDFREVFREQAKVYQEDYRRTGLEAIELFDRESHLEMLVQDRLPLSEAVGVVEENRARLILPETRGADPAQWELDQFPLNLHSGRKTRIHTIHPFSDALRKDIWQFKEDVTDPAQRASMARQFGRFISQNLPEDINLSDYDYILPIPARASSLERREGFSPVESIAHALGVETQTPIATGILTDLSESPLKDLSRRERQAITQADRFRLDRPEQVAGANILLFDDVLTTGATTQDAVNALQAANPENIDVVTMAFRPWLKDYSQLKGFHKFKGDYGTWKETDIDRPPEWLIPEQQLALPAPAKYPPTPSQQRAIEHTYGTGVVIAGPGSGKTETLIQRMRHLTEQNRATPDDILTLVFGKKAEQDLHRRAGEEWNISTIDAFSRRLVRENYELLGYEKPPEITTQTFKDWLPAAHDYLRAQGIEGDFRSPELISDWSSQYKAIQQTFLEGKEDYSSLPEPLQQAINLYRHKNYSENRMTFTDATLQAGYLLEQHPAVRSSIREQFPFVQIDEFQDVSPLQNRLLSQLSPNLWAVGDLDQSIMQFRGGGGDVMIDKIREGAALYNIEENFRSSPEIVEAAQGFIGQNYGRMPLNQTPTRESGAPINILESLGNQGRDVDQLVEQIQRGRETAVLTRTIRERDAYQERVTKALQKQGWGPDELSNVYYSTIHAAKGKEWQDVILPLNLLEKKQGELDRTFPTRHAKTVEELAEEERLFYVGMTRAEDNLTVIGQPKHPYIQALRPEPVTPATYFEDVTAPELRPLNRLQQWIKDRRWAEPLQQITNIAQTGAIINAAAEITWESVMAAAGHDFSTGGLLRAGAEAGVAIGINQLNRRFGARGVVPEAPTDLSTLPINAATPNSTAHLRTIFEDATSGMYGRGSLSAALAKYDTGQLNAMLGEETALKLKHIASNTERFGQKSFQGERDWGATLAGLFTGDIPTRKQFVYDPEAIDVKIETGTPWTLDRLLDNRLTQGWRQRREHLRQHPEEDRLRHLLGPLQPEDATPSLWYGILPEARGISKFLGRYRAEPPAGTQGWLDRDVAEIPAMVLDTIGAKRTAERMQTARAERIAQAQDRADALTDRKLTPELYQWQDPDHFYQQTAASLGIDVDLEARIQKRKLGSPYHKWSQHLYQIPKPLQYPLLIGGGAAAGYYGAELIHSLFFEDEKEPLTLQDPHSYSMSKRFPLLKAASFTAPVRRLRAKGENLIDDIYEEGTFHGEMMQSLIIGKKGNLPKDVKDTFLETGQYHALVQSGMHVNLFANILKRYPALAIPPIVSTVADVINPPETVNVEPETPWYEGYTLAKDPWLPRWNPPHWKRPRNFEAPAWAWWDTDPDSDAKFERIMKRRGGSQRMDTGYLYQITNPEGKSYVGLSTKDPYSSRGRIRAHLSGRGSKSIKADLDRFQKSEFTTESWEFNDISYTELARKERERIAALGEDAYNRSAGGEIRVPSLLPERLDTQPFKLQDIGAYGIYSMFGILPEAIYTQSQERKKAPAAQVLPKHENPLAPKGIGLSDETLEPLSEKVIYAEPAPEPDIDKITDAVLEKISETERTVY